MELPAIDLEKLFEAGMHVTVVPTPQMMLQKNEELRQQKSEEKASASNSEEEMLKYLQNNMPLKEIIKTFRDILSKNYPESNCMILAAQKGPKRTEVSYEHSGRDIDVLSSAFTDTMHKDGHAFYLFKNVLYMFMRTANPSEAETAITGIQDLIKDLSNMNNLFDQIKLKNAEIKRLKKINRMDLVEIKEKEIQELKLLSEKRIAIKKKREENLKKARAALAEKRRKAKNKVNSPQPNFAKMAKQQRQKIAARQAEKKKKKSSSSGTEYVSSCSQLLKCN